MCKISSRGGSRGVPRGGPPDRAQGGYPPGPPRRAPFGGTPQVGVPRRAPRPRMGRGAKPPCDPPALARVGAQAPAPGGPLVHVLTPGLQNAPLVGGARHPPWAFAPQRRPEGSREDQCSHGGGSPRAHGVSTGVPTRACGYCGNQRRGGRPCSASWGRRPAQSGGGRAWREEGCRAPGREPSLGARRETSSSPTRLCLVRSASLRLAAPSSGRPGAICVAPGRAQRIGSGREPPHSP